MSDPRVSDPRALPRPGRTVVVGVVNVTPDSFSDGGRWYEPQAAIGHGRDLVAQGADLIDVGGESTRPGADRPSQDEELRRVLPVVESLAPLGVGISVDTMRPEVARQAVACGATLINDVSGGMADPQMLTTVAELGVPYLLMHWRGHSLDMQSRAVYHDVVTEVRDELARQVEVALAAGIAEQRLVLDPGLGFAKTAEHNWALLRRADFLDPLGLPVLWGVSRKAFLGRLLANGEQLRPAVERDDATVAVTTALALAGAWGVRTHTVRAHRDAIAVAEQLRHR
ncbi:MAG TPA: dihydropteroate synthase [Candidatus Avipropionibacterium avicola]|uniref:Dihydropteroate synthase n=1 Tax=Candidatus Avipropionibacterium avicola TaxID=2840701 RepID=A0A9D1GXH9_9ACTN|nr:dihydropteroate synthase [Candidatus Avipropionibacterium avicola]